MRVNRPEKPIKVKQEAQHIEKPIKAKQEAQQTEKEELGQAGALGINYNGIAVRSRWSIMFRLRQSLRLSTAGAGTARMNSKNMPSVRSHWHAKSEEPRGESDHAIGEDRIST